VKYRQAPRLASQDSGGAVIRGCIVLGAASDARARRRGAWHEGSPGPVAGLTCHKACGPACARAPNARLQRRCICNRAVQQQPLFVTVDSLRKPLQSSSVVLLRKHRRIPSPVRSMCNLPRELNTAGKPFDKRQLDAPGTIA